MVTRVGALAYPGCFGSDLFCVLDLLVLANRVATHGQRAAPFVTSVHAARPGLIPMIGGTAVRARRIDYSLDLLIVPGFDFDPSEDVPARLDGWRPEVALLRRAGERGVRLAGVSVGAFLLGEARLLDGRRATTCWILANRLQREYPRATVDRNALIVEDGPVITSGAFSAAADLALHVVREVAGPDLAQDTARITLNGGRASQTPFIDDSLIDRSEGAFSAEVRRTLTANLHRQYDLGTLAAAHHVSTRTMLRRFRAETGQSPLDFLQAARVGRARQVLESTDLSIAEIALSVGYRDVRTFRRLFGGIVGLSPAQYRRTFRRTRT